MSKRSRKIFFNFFKKKILHLSQKVRNKRDFFLLIFVVICFFVTAFSFVWLKIRLDIANIKSSGVIVEFENKESDKFLSPEKFELPLAAVIIDNHIDSRPSIGLSAAFFIWEAPVEAGITRFMAIFPLDKEEEEVEKIGPVRSLRPYFIDWAAELGAILIHCGGSPDALSITKENGTRHIDQFYFDNYFWRIWKRYAPHNLLTSTEKLREATKDMNYKMVNFGEWIFKNDAEFLGRPKKQEISIDSWLPEHKIKWIYSTRRNDYERLQGGSVHKDEEGNEIRAKNIIIQFTDVKIIDSIGRREIRTMGEGRAIVFMDGKRISAFWKKPSQEERTRFYDEHGEELSFNKGTTWVEIVPIDTGLTIIE